MFKKQYILKFGYQFLLYNTYYLYLLMKEIDNILTHFGDATYQKYIFLAARCVQLDNGVTSPWLQEWEGELQLCWLLLL